MAETLAEYVIKVKYESDLDKLESAVSRVSATIDALNKKKINLHVDTSTGVASTEAKVQNLDSVIKSLTEKVNSVGTKKAQNSLDEDPRITEKRKAIESLRDQLVEKRKQTTLARLEAIRSTLENKALGSTTQEKSVVEEDPQVAEKKQAIESLRDQLVEKRKQTTLARLEAIRSTLENKALNPTARVKTSKPSDDPAIGSLKDQIQQLKDKKKTEGLRARVNKLLSTSRTTEESSGWYTYKLMKSILVGIPKYGFLLASGLIKTIVSGLTGLFGLYSLGTSGAMNLREEQFKYERAMSTGNAYTSSVFAANTVGIQGMEEAIQSIAKSLPDYGKTSFVNMLLAKEGIKLNDKNATEVTEKLIEILSKQSLTPLGTLNPAVQSMANTLGLDPMDILRFRKYYPEYLQSKQRAQNIDAEMGVNRNDPNNIETINRLGNELSDLRRRYSDFLYGNIIKIAPGLERIIGLLSEMLTRADKLSTFVIALAKSKPEDIPDLIRSFTTGTFIETTRDYVEGNMRSGEDEELERRTNKNELDFLLGNPTPKKGKPGTESKPPLDPGEGIIDRAFNLIGKIANKAERVIQHWLAYYKNYPAFEKQYGIKGIESRYNLPPNMLGRIAYIESNFNNEAISPKGAMGLMQLMPSTGNAYGLHTHADFMSPAKNIDAGARLLKDLLEKYKGNQPRVLIAYNAGEGTLRNYENPKNKHPHLPNETLDYLYSYYHSIRDPIDRARFYDQIQEIDRLKGNKLFEVPELRATDNKPRPMSPGFDLTPKLGTGLPPISLIHNNTYNIHGKDAETVAQTIQQNFNRTQADNVRWLRTNIG